MIKTYSLLSHLDRLDMVFDHIEMVWNDRNGSLGIRDYLNEKVPLIQSEKIKGVMLYKDDRLAGVGWVDIGDLCYGSMMFHHLEEGVETELVISLLDLGLLDGVLVELLTFWEEPGLIYRDILEANGFFGNYRQRMALDLKKPYFFDADFSGVRFETLTTDLLPISSRISLAAHQYSLDQKHAPDLDHYEGRLALAQHICSGKFGEVLDSSSLLMWRGEDPIGFILVVAIKCWGLDKVPWVFDVCVDPKYIGQGYGKKLFCKSLGALTQLEYSFFGLSVTNSNTIAKYLYEKCGFFKVDEFVEYTRLKL